jgi:hypothetical protein
MTSYEDLPGERDLACQFAGDGVAIIEYALHEEDLARMDAFFPALPARTAGASAALCLADRGDIVAMRLLLLHRSQRAKMPAARRVIHIEYTRGDYLQSVQRPALAS